MNGARDRAGDSVDVLVAGGGPAGATAALVLARRGFRVFLAERSRYEAPRAGERLPSYAAKLLSDLGLWDRVEAAVPSSAICAAWGGSEIATQHFLYDPLGPAWHVDRRRFDAMLADAAADAGATVFRGTKVGVIERVDRGFAVNLESTTERRTSYARAIVDATGRGARLARALGARRVVYDRLIGIAATMAPRGLPGIGDALLIEAADDGWWYSAPLPDDSLLVACMTDSDLLARSRCGPVAAWASAIKRTLHTRRRTQGFAPVEDTRVRNASTSRLDHAAGAGWLAIGDAASARDPLAADGVCTALASGMSGAVAVDAYLNGEAGALDHHAEAAAASFEQYLVERAHYYALERRWPASLFWSRRHPVPGHRATRRSLAMTSHPPRDHSQAVTGRAASRHAADRKPWPR